VGCCRLLGRAARAGHLLPRWAGLPARCWRLRRALLGRAHSPALAAAAAAPAPALATALGRARCWAAPLRWAARLLPFAGCTACARSPAPARCCACAAAATPAGPLLRARPLGRCRACAGPRPLLRRCRAEPWATRPVSVVPENRIA